MKIIAVLFVAPMLAQAAPSVVPDLSRQVGVVSAAVAGGKMDLAAQGLDGLFSGTLPKSASNAAVYTGGGTQFSAGGYGLKRAGGPREGRRGFAVPAVDSSENAAHLVKIGDTDANPIRHDNAQREAGTWGSTGAAGGAATGGVVGAVAGGVVGAVAGAISGHASDIKEKMDRDEKSYQDGKAAADRDHQRNK